MITLKPTNDREIVKEYYEKNGIAFNEFSNLLLATEKDNVLGYCLFDTQKVLTVHKIEPQNDLSLLDGVLRSTLHVGCERGVFHAFYSATAPENAFETLKFIKNKDDKSLNVDKLFKSCCDCK